MTARPTTVEEKGGGIRNLRKEFHEKFAKGSDNLEAFRSSMGDTVKVLVTAVTNDRELTKKLCVAVERLESGQCQNREGETGRVKRPTSPHPKRISGGPSVRGSAAGSCNPEEAVP